MDFSYSKTEQLFLQMVRSFAENEVKPLAAEIDEQERFPIETVEKMGKLGMMGIPIPKQYGGAGGTVQMYIMAVEELSRRVLSFRPTPRCVWLPSWSTAPRSRR